MTGVIRTQSRQRTPAHWRGPVLIMYISPCGFRSALFSGSHVPQSGPCYNLHTHLHLWWVMRAGHQQNCNRGQHRGCSQMEREPAVLLFSLPLWQQTNIWDRAANRELWSPCSIHRVHTCMCMLPTPTHAALTCILGFKPPPHPPPHAYWAPSQVPAWPVQPLCPPTPSHSQSQRAAATFSPLSSSPLHSHPLWEAVNHWLTHWSTSRALVF